MRCRVALSLIRNVHNIGRAVFLQLRVITRRTFKAADPTALTERAAALYAKIYHSVSIFKFINHPGRECIHLRKTMTLHNIPFI